MAKNSRGRSCPQPFNCFAILGCISLRKSKIGFLNLKESENGFFCFFMEKINPRSLGSWCIKETEKSTLEVDSSVPLIIHDPEDLEVICSIKKCKIHLWILSDLRIQSWILLKKHTLECNTTELRNVNIQSNTMICCIITKVLTRKPFLVTKLSMLYVDL